MNDEARHIVDFLGFTALASIFLWQCGDTGAAHNWTSFAFCLAAWMAFTNFALTSMGKMGAKE